MSFQENLGFPNSLRLVAEGLSCQRSERMLFANLSFSIESGHALTIVGPNGAGKSSLLRILGGFLSAQAGQLRLEGMAEDTERQQICHYLGHRDGLRAALTARENLDFARDILGAGLETPDALARVGLLQIMDAPVGLLSAGQRRRVALARLLVAKRPLWLLDEPTSALDQASQERVTEILSDHLGNGGLAVIASHLSLGIASETLTLGLPV